MSLEVTLSKNSWHFRLQKQIWGSQRPYLNSLCPYFWFTVLTVLITPIYFTLSFLAMLGGLLAKPFLWLWCRFEAWVMYVLQERTLDWISRNDPMDVLVQVGWFESWRRVKNKQPWFLFYYLDKWEVAELLRKVYGEKEIDKLLYGNDNAIWKQKHASFERYEVKECDPLWWRPLVHYTKLGVKVFTLAWTAIFIALGFYHGVIKLMGLDEHGWTVLYFLVLGLIGSVGVAILLWEYIWKPAINWKPSAPKKVYNSTSLFWNMLVSSFKKVCPAINWQEDSENNSHHS